MSDTMPAVTSAQDRADQLDRVEAKLDDLLEFADDVREALEPFQQIAQSGASPMALLSGLLGGARPPINGGS